MLSLTRKTDYAIVAMADLARRGASKTSAREVSESTKVPLPVLTNILHQLLHHGLVTSTMGAKGGYCIAKPADQINLADMIDAIEGSFRLTVCCDSELAETEDSCDLEENCRIKGPVQRVHSSLRHFLRQVTLAEIAFDSVQIGMALTDVTGQSERPPVTTPN